MKWMCFICVLALSLGCKEGSESLQVPYNQEDSPFYLPYPVGTEYVCMQAWNGSLSHYGVFSYAVDFSMQIGTIVTASRRGIVEWIESGYSNSDSVPGHENVIIIRHEDSTFARYVHLSPGSARVHIGQSVNIGDTLAFSGQSGTPIPHLHFDITKGCNDRNCQTIPFVFFNTISQPHGPVVGTVYPAQ